MLRFLQVLIVFLVAQGCLYGEQEGQRPYIYCQKKWGELKWEGLKIRVLKLRAEQFPPGKTYTLFIQNCDGSRTQVFDYKSNKNGHLIIDLKEDLKKGAPFAVTPLRRGEKLSYSMLSEDRSEEFMTSIVPFPIETFKNGASLAVELLDAKGTAFVCVGQGFNPGEQVQVRCKSGEKICQEMIRVGEDGAFKCPLWPSVEGKDSGTASVSVKRKKEEIAVPFAWGREAQEFVGAICLQIH